MTAAAIIEQAVRASARIPRERPILFSAPMVRATLRDEKTETRRLKGLDFVNDQPGAWRLEGWADGYPDGKRRVVFRMEEGPREPGSIGIYCPYGQAGDFLWVREAWSVMNKDRTTVILHGHHQAPEEGLEIVYRASEEHGHRGWRPSIHLPRWASRILLQITNVRVERLQALTEEDAIAEGVRATKPQDSWSVFHDDGSGGTVFVEPVIGERGVRDFVKVVPHPLLVKSARDNYSGLWNDLNPHAPWSTSPWVWVVSFKRIDPSTAKGS